MLHFVLRVLLIFVLSRYANTNLPYLDLRFCWLLLIQIICRLVIAEKSCSRYLFIFQKLEFNPRQHISLLEIQEHCPQHHKIAVLHRFQWRLVCHYVQRQTVLRAPVTIIVEIHLLVRCQPDGVERRSDHVDHAGE